MSDKVTRKHRTSNMFDKCLETDIGNADDNIASCMTTQILLGSEFEYIHNKSFESPSTGDRTTSIKDDGITICACAEVKLTANGRTCL